MQKCTFWNLGKTRSNVQNRSKTTFLNSGATAEFEFHIFGKQNQFFFEKKIHQKNFFFHQKKKLQKKKSIFKPKI